MMSSKGNDSFRVLDKNKCVLNMCDTGNLILIKIGHLPVQAVDSAVQHTQTQELSSKNGHQILLLF